MVEVWGLEDGVEERLKEEVKPNQGRREGVVVAYPLSTEEPCKPADEAGSHV